MVAIIIFKNDDYNDGDDDDDDQRSTLEDVSSARKSSTSGDLWPQKIYDYKSADNRIVIMIPTKKIYNNPWLQRKDDSSV